MPNNKCNNCGDEIAIMIFKWGNWCSELCRKTLVKKKEDVIAMVANKLSKNPIPTANEVRRDMGFANA